MNSGPRPAMAGPRRPRRPRAHARTRRRPFVGPTAARAPAVQVPSTRRSGNKTGQRERRSRRRRRILKENEESGERNGTSGRAREVKGRNKRYRVFGRMTRSSQNSWSCVSDFLRRGGQQNKTREKRKRKKEKEKEKEKKKKKGAHFSIGRLPCFSVFIIF